MADETQPVQADTSRWSCSLCEYPVGWFGKLELGPGWVSDSSTGFGNYRGLDEQGLFPSIGGEAHYRDERGRYLDMFARNLALDSRQFDIRGGSQGRHAFRLAYTQTPKFHGHETQSPFRGVGGANPTLPVGWVRANLTSGMTKLEQSLADTKLKTTRKALDAGLKLKLPAKWIYRIDFQHQKKDGLRPYGGGLFLSNTTHIPAPVDFTTNQFDMALEYAGERGNLSFGFAGSSFDNGTPAVTWDNPFSSGPGTEAFRADLAPNNTYYQFSLTGAWTPMPKLRFSGRAAIGRMKQNDPFLPYSINPQFSERPLPRTSLEGKIDTATINLAGKMTARLSRRVDLTARFKLDERDNKTAIDQWTPILTDVAPTPGRPNRPYSFKREKIYVEMRWRAGNSVRLLGGLRQENTERTLQSVEETSQLTYWGEAALNPWAVAQFRVKLETSNRNASPYQQLSDGGPVENPLMRKFHLADRDRDRAVIELDLSPSERLGISISVFSARDKYSESIVGLRESEERSLSLDLNYAMNRNVNIYAFANRDDIESEMASVSADTGLPWGAITDDKIITLGVGFSGKVSNKISIGFDWISSEARGNLLTGRGLGEAPFPTLKSDLQNARLNVSYRVNEHWAMKVYAEHEKYDSTDWAIDNLGPDGIISVLTMGGVSPNYGITTLRLLASYKF